MLILGCAGLGSEGDGAKNPRKGRRSPIQAERFYVCRPVLSDVEALEFDLRPQLDDALGRNLEVIRRADGIAPHEGV
jgi:hypothetical protein